METPDRIEWNSALQTHVPAIDEQHQILVNALNEANAKFCGPVSHDVIDQILRDLLSYAIYHFETEESLMLERGYAVDYPEMADLHRQQHRGFSATVLALRSDFNATGNLDKDATLVFLKDWLINHIMNTDQHLGRFLVGGSTPRE